MLQTLGLYFLASLALSICMTLAGYALRKAGYRNPISEFLSTFGLLLSRASVILITALTAYLLLNGAILLGWPRGLFSGVLGALLLVGTVFSMVVLVFMVKRAARYSGHNALRN